MANHKSPAPSRPIKRIKNPAKDMARLWRIPFSNETDPSNVERALRERIKELNCLYGLAQLAERHSDSIEDLLDDLVHFLPHSWQYPEITRVRISFQGKTYKSQDVKVTNWRQTAPINIYNQVMGDLTIFYLEERPAADEGPFLKEERALIEAVAERIGTIAMHIAAEKELQEINRQLTVERKALQDTNLALRAVLMKIEEEKQAIYLDVKVNVEKVLMPILNALAMELPKNLRQYAELLRTSLEEITSPFINRLSQKYHSLTPTEISICNMIRNGLRTKEIATLRGVSPSTINRHREHIRRKLDISNMNVNLITYLQSEMRGSSQGA